MTRMMRRRTLRGLAATALGSLLPAFARANGRAEAPNDPLKFSMSQPGEKLPQGWIHQTLPGVERANRFDLMADAGTTVLRIRSERSASSLTCSHRIDPAVMPLLKWRWRVSHPIAGSDWRSKSGDDYAARLYVLFDLPGERLSLADRMKISAARMLHGAEIPSAALCYVWGNAQAAGESGWNPYTDRVRMLVVDSGSAHAGTWREHVRDIAADFRSAFGDPVPPVSGIALGADTDNTGEQVEAHFGDPVFQSRP
jgi:hypothetical protein